MLMDDVEIVITLDTDYPFFPNPVNDFLRMEADVDQVACAINEITVSLGFEDGIQRMNVAVNIGDEEELHSSRALTAPRTAATP